jgi:Peptidase family M50
MIILWFVFGLWIAMIVHELGHAGFGWLVGVRPKQIVIGGEPTLFRMRAGETEFILNALPDTAQVAPYFIVGRTKFRYGVFIAGGVLANAIACAFFIALKEWGYVSPSAQTVYGALALAQACGVVLNATPWPSRQSDAPDEGSDGNQLWRHLRNGQDVTTPYFEALVAPYRDTAAPNEKPSWSAGLILDCRLRPNRWTSPNVQFDVFAALTRELARGGMTRAEEMLTLETLISDWFVFAGPATPAEVDQWSQRLLNLGPNIDTVKGTRGAVLTMLGNHEEGKTIMTALLQKPNLTPVDQLLNSAFLAHAEFGLGNSAEARDAIAAVRCVSYFDELPEHPADNRYIGRANWVAWPES